MLGGAEEWFDRGLGGIDFDMARAKGERIMVRPRVVDGVDWVRASYDSRLGMVRSAWRREDSELTMEVNVPVNASATVWVPVREGDAIAAPSGAVKVREERGAVVYRVASGAWRFVVKAS